MPGQAWRRPGDGPTEPRADAEPALPIRRAPVAPELRRIGASQVDEKITDLENSLGLDSATRLSSANGGSPADAQSPPISPVTYNGLSLVVGGRVARLGSNKWTLASIGAMALVLVIALSLLAMKASWISFWLGLAGFFLGSAFLARSLQRGS